MGTTRVNQDQGRRVLTIHTFHKSPTRQTQRVAETYNAYGMKCKEKRDFEGRVETTDSGRRMAKGACPVCGTTVNKFLPKA